MAIWVEDPRVFEDGGIYSAYCDELERASSGITPKDAEENLKNAIIPYYRLLEEIGLLEKRLEEKGIGELLANGVARLAQRIGNRAEEFAIQVKGVEAGQHEPRLKQFMGLNFMINPTGADHNLSMVFELDTDELMEPLRPLALLEVLPADDKLPLRFFQPKTDGALAEKGLDPEKMEKAKRYYYTLMGCDADTGIPLQEKLEELGITYP